MGKMERWEMRSGLGGGDRGVGGCSGGWCNGCVVGGEGMWMVWIRRDCEFEGTCMGSILSTIRDLYMSS